MEKGEDEDTPMKIHQCFPVDEQGKQIDEIEPHGKMRRNENALLLESFFRCD